MAKIELIINGEKLTFFDSFSYSTQLDSVESSLSFNTFVNYDAYDYVPITAYRDGVLIFTGEIINKKIYNYIPPKPFNYKAKSLPYILNCTLPTEAYPLQLENSTLKDILEYICSFFNITIVFDKSAQSEASNKYKLSDLGLGKKAFELINDLVTQEGLILSHDSYGKVIVTKTILQNEIILPRFTSNGISFDLEKFYHNYIALGQAPIEESNDIQAISRWDNIDSRRNITQIQNSGTIDTIEKKAEGMRLDSLKSIGNDLTFNNFFCNVGDFVKVGDNKLIINKVDYTYNVGVDACSISLIDSQIYDR